MRHGNKVNALSRTKSHRDALLKNMSSSLIEHKRITTTLAKAKALRSFIEPLITKSKLNNTHSRRVVFSYLQNKSAVDTLFTDIRDHIINRPGGYLRIIKLGPRKSDSTEMALIEFVDYNTVYNPNESLDGDKAKSRSRRRRSSKSSGVASDTTSSAATEEVVETVEETIVEAPVEVETPVEVVEEVVAEETAMNEETTAADETAAEETENKEA